MTEKMKTFCLEYLIDENATQAAIRAGYSKKTAKSIGSENLSKPDIQEYIEKLKSEIINDKEKIILDNILLWREIIKDKKSKQSDRLKASELLGKYAAMFTEKLDLIGDIIIKTDDDDSDL